MILILMREEKAKKIYVCLCCLAFHQLFSCSLSSLVLLPFGFRFSLIQLQRGGSIWACLWNKKKKTEKESEHGEKFGF